MNKNDDSTVVYALDYETTYGDELSITPLGIQRYARETEVFLVSVVGSDGYEFVGPPELFDHSMLNHHTVVCHNVSFDAGIFRYALGLDDSSIDWRDSAGLTAYLQSGRSLKNASWHLLRKDVSKVARDAFKNRSRAELEDEDLFGVSMASNTHDYCLTDSRLTLEIWQKYSHLWPESEQKLSKITWEACHRGVAIDLAGVDAGVNAMGDAMADAEKSVPWRAQGVLSSSARKKYLVETLGFEPWQLPQSFAATDKDYLKFVAENDIPALGHLKRYHRAAVAKKKLESIRRRSHESVMPYELMYAGAPHTLRWVGAGGDDNETGGGVNMQNLPQKPFENVDMRSLFIPRRGHKMIIADYSAIEGVVLAWVSKDKTTLDLFRQGKDFYESNAISMGLYDGDRGPLKSVDPDLRQRVKVMSLGAQYRMGGQRLGDLVDDLELGKELVRLFRELNPAVVSLWSRLETRILEDSEGGKWRMPLPSGRSIRYENIHTKEGKYGEEIWCQTSKDRSVRPINGGLLVENLVQGIARDVLADALLKQDGNPLWSLLWTIHDEIVFESEAQVAETASAEIKKLMEEPPSWASDLPLRVEPEITNKFKK